MLYKDAHNRIYIYTGSRDSLENCMHVYTCAYFLISNTGGFCHVYYHNYYLLLHSWLHTDVFLAVHSGSSEVGGPKVEQLPVARTSMTTGGGGSGASRHRQGVATHECTQGES